MKPSRIMALLFLASLAVRLALWWPVAQAGVPPVYDEMAYARAAVGYQNVVAACVRGGVFWAQPAETDLRRAYSKGHYPPLHPLLLGLAFAAFGRDLALARLAVVVQSALTTCLVYTFTARLANRRAALAAAGAHLLYPSFLAYSHFLWSETTYILALLAGLYFAIRAVDQQRWTARAGFVIGCGVCLGLAGLTRAAVLPLLIVVPGWLAWAVRSPVTRRPERSSGLAEQAAPLCSARRVRGGQVWRFAAPAAALTACVITLSPWLAALYANEGRLVPLSAGAGWTSYLKNNPWASGDSLAPQEEQARPQMLRTITRYARAHQVSRDQAARALAIEHIRNDFTGFLGRCLDRARALLAPDWFVMRYVLYAAYPPMPQAAAVLIWLLLGVSFLALLTLCVVGLLRGGELRHRSLLLACVLLGATPHILTVSNSRMGLPLLAVLLPAVGVGLTALRARRGWLPAGLTLACVVLAFAAINWNAARDAVGLPRFVSSHYASALAWWQRMLGVRDVDTQDCVILRTTADRAARLIRVDLPGDRYVLAERGQRSAVWRPSDTHGTVRLKIRAAGSPPTPLEIRLGAPRDGRSLFLRPVQSRAWQRWQPTGLPDVEYTWTGSSGLSPTEVERLLADRIDPNEPAER